MKATIEIDCEDEAELLNHISAIKARITREIKKQKGYLLEPIHFEDNNCWGTHEVMVFPECGDKHFPDGNGFCLSCGAQLGVEIVIK